MAIRERDNQKAEAPERTAPRVEKAVISSLPKTLEAAQRELSDMAREGESLRGERFLLHTANALYLAEQEYARKMVQAGGVENKMPKMSRSQAVNSLLGSEYFRRFCENRKNASDMAKLFAGDGGAERALRMFGSAIKQVNTEKNMKHPAHQPEAEKRKAEPEPVLGSP